MEFIIFRVVVWLQSFEEINQSAKTEIDIEKIHMAKYGREDKNPFDFSEKRRTCFIYVGSSVIKVSYP